MKLVSAARGVLLVGFTCIAVPLLAQSSMQVKSSGPSGVLKGTVMTDKTERPLLNAKVTIPQLGLSAMSDSVGDFTIAGVSVGTFDVLVVLNGFESLRSSFNFSDGEKIAVDFALSERVVQYGPKTAADIARASVDISRMGLEERRSMGAGRYITIDELVKTNGKTTAEFVAEKVPGLHANKIGGNSRALASDEKVGTVEPSEADRKSGAKTDCYIRVLLNGNVMYENAKGSPLFDVNSVPIAMIISVDYFRAAETPPEFQTAGARCGTLQVMTRGR